MSQFVLKSLAACLVIGIWGAGCTEPAPGFRDIDKQNESSPDTIEDDATLSDAGTSGPDASDAGSGPIPDVDPDNPDVLADAGAPDVDSPDTHSPDVTSPDAGHPAPDATTDAGPGEPDVQTDNGSISLYLAGDLSAKSFNDHYVGQTPKAFEVAISQYDIQTSRQAATGVNCFELDEPVVADLLQDNLLGSCDTESLPTGEYTHGRVKVEWVRFTVDGTLHTAALATPGEVTFFKAYSETDYDGESYDAGEGWVEFTGLTTQRFPAEFDHSLPSGGGLRAEVIDDEYWLTFPFSSRLPVLQHNNDDHWARLSMEVYESFRWDSRRTFGYDRDAWDVNIYNPSRSEEIMVRGISGYYVTTSMD